LDAKLDEYYRMNIFSSEEMKEYVAYREHLTELAIAINKTIGVYYETLEHVIEVYTIPWTTKGFSDEALLKIAHYCFVSGVRNLEGMNTVVGKFYSQGYLTAEGVDEFVSAGLKQDGKIKEIIERNGGTRNVTAKDREFYRTWSVTWGFDDSVILYAAELAVGKTFPMPFMNQLLSGWKNAGVTTVEDAKKASNVKKHPETYTERSYSDDELKSLFGDIENFDNLDV
jgi:DnaD/phage-associated family protein